MTIEHTKSKLVHEGQYVAEVEVDLIIEDAYKLDDVREALKRKDTKTASAYGKVYELRPVILSVGVIRIARIFQVLYTYKKEKRHGENSSLSGNN